MEPHSAWQSFLLTFVPLFIVIDAVGNLPFVIAFSEDMTRRERSRMISSAIMTAALLGFFFLFLGRLVLGLMNISVGSFAIGGGVILLVLSVSYMMSNKMPEVDRRELAAVVPIGTPLTMGPAAITTLLLLATQFPIYWVVISFVLNIIIVWFIFLFSQVIMRFLGKGGIRAVSKIASLFLAAIAVNMIIQGLNLTGIITSP